MTPIPTDLAHRQPPQISEPTEKPDGCSVLRSCSPVGLMVDVDEEGLDNRLSPSQKRIIRSVQEASLIMRQRELDLLVSEELL